MKIVRLIQEFPKEINRGLAPNVYYISKEQVRQGHKVWVFSFTKNRPSKEIIEEINIHRIKKPPKIRWSSGLYFLKAIKNANINPDIIHGLNPITFGWLFPYCKSLINCKYIFSLHSSLFSFQHRYFKTRKSLKQAKEFYRLGKIISQNTDHIIIIAKFIKQELIKIGVPEEKISIIPSGINLKIFKYNPDAVKNNTILYIGRFSQMKGIPYLIKAFYKIKKKYPEYKLRLIGGSENDNDWHYTNQLIDELNLRNNIEIIKSVPHHLLFKYYQKASVFILPSVSEPFGKVALESLACGCPIIGTNTGGLVDIIKNEINGILIQPKSSQKIVSAFEKILNNNSLKEKLIQNGLKTVKKYDWEIITKKYDEIFLKNIS